MMSTIVEVLENSDFTIHNLPFGVFSLKTENMENARCGTRLGDFVIDLRYLEEKKIFNGEFMSKLDKKVFDKPSLNDFMNLGKPYWSEVRKTLQTFLTKNENKNMLNQFAIESKNVNMHLPAQIGDYTDFYSSKNHAYNLGCILRDPERALQPNWSWLPVAYHGRASSVVLSGTNIRRPKGQVKPPTEKEPKFALSKKMDFELEVGAFVGTGNNLGEPIDINNAEDKVFGLVLMNDLSARDLQGWEYVPLGPFTAKNLGTVISPWVVTLEALQPFRVELGEQNPPPLDYLKDPKLSSFDINLQVNFKAEKTQEELLSTSNLKYLYWSIPQQLTHHTVSGCNMRPGDLLGSGTISGTKKEEYGSLIELCWNGKKPIQTNDGERTFLQDNDEIIFYGYAVKDNIRVGFGECRTKVLPHNN